MEKYRIIKNTYEHGLITYDVETSVELHTSGTIWKRTGKELKSLKEAKEHIKKRKSLHKVKRTIVYEE